MGILNQLAYIVGFDYFLAQDLQHLDGHFFPSPITIFFFRVVMYGLRWTSSKCVVCSISAMNLDKTWVFFLSPFWLSIVFQVVFSGCQRFGPVWFGWAPLLFSCLDRNMIFNWLSATRVGKLFPDGWKHPETLCQNSRHHYGSIFLQGSWYFVD